MAALIVAEDPEVAEGLDTVMTCLTTTSRRDAFQLQISIHIPKASRRLREFTVTSTFSRDFDRTIGADKLRLLINCGETACRKLQERRHSTIGYMSQIEYKQGFITARTLTPAEP